jgi:hypothetical protein
MTVNLHWLSLIELKDDLLSTLMVRGHELLLVNDPAIGPNVVMKLGYLLLQHLVGLTLKLIV